MKDTERGIHLSLRTVLPNLKLITWSSTTGSTLCRCSTCSSFQYLLVVSRVYWEALPQSLTPRTWTWFVVGFGVVPAWTNPTSRSMVVPNLSSRTWSIQFMYPVFSTLFCHWELHFGVGFSTNKSTGGVNIVSFNTVASESKVRSNLQLKLNVSLTQVVLLVYRLLECQCFVENLPIHKPFYFWEIISSCGHNLNMMWT